MDRLGWCFRQGKGIALTQPNENLSEAYIKKSHKALLASLSLKGNLEWEICALYYSMYFSVYSILMRIGVKSEIHMCTILFMEKYLGEYFSSEEIALLKRSMAARIDYQYHQGANVSMETCREMRQNAPILAVKCKELRIDINKIRERVRKSYEIPEK